MELKSHNMDPVLFEHYLREKTTLAETTIRGYTDEVKRFILREPELDDVGSYNDYILDKSFRRRGYMTYYALKYYIQYKVEDARLKRDILDRLIMPKMKNDLKRKRIYLDEDQLINVINNIEKKKHRVMTLLQMITGCRVGDILSITRDDVHVEEQDGDTVIVFRVKGKGDRVNIIHVYDEVFQRIFLDYMMDNDGVYKDYCFISDKIRGCSWADNDNEAFLKKTNYVLHWRDLKLALGKCGIALSDFASHDIRRCFARRVWEKYKDLYVLKNMLNHQNIETSLRYLRHSGMHTREYHKEMQS